MSECSEVTCLIPTYNRPEFLRRLLTYFASVKPSWTLLIADSSHDIGRAANEAVVAEFRSKLHITYQHFNLDLITKCRVAFGMIQTPHVVLCADDDFVSPSTVDECVDFLSTHPDYAVCQGISIITEKRDSGLRHKVEMGFPVDSSDVCERLQSFASNWFAPFYAVYRTPHLRQIFDQVAASASVDRCRILAEFLQSFLAVTDGKLQVLPKFFAIRQSHPTNACAISPPSVSDADFDQLATQFRDCLLKSIQRSALVNPAVADRAIMSCQDAAAAAIKQWRERRPSGLRRIVFEVLRPFRRVSARMSQGPRVRFTRSVPLSELMADPCFAVAAQLTDTFPVGMPLEVNDLRRAA